MDYENEFMDSRYVQSRENKLTIEYDEDTNDFNILNNKGEVIGTMDKTNAEPIVSSDVTINGKEVIFNNSQEERKRTIEYLKRLKKMSKQQLEEEKQKVINELFDLGDDLNGNNLSYRDLQLALITGKDLDGIDIPNDTPEEREAEEYIDKEKVYEKGIDD